LEEALRPRCDPKIIVAQAASRVLNPTLPQSVIDRAMERDAASARAEYLAEFRTDVCAFIDSEIVLSCVMKNVRELLPARSVSYRAFADPSGGSSDSFSCAIGHHDGTRDVCIIDCLREFVPPFSPEFVVVELAQLLKSYNVSSVTGDRYGGEWPREAFARYGISYELSSLPKSGLYGALLPLLNSGRIDLLDNQRLVSQLTNLERRVARGGREAIDHPTGRWRPHGDPHGPARRPARHCRPQAPRRGPSPGKFGLAAATHAASMSGGLGQKSCPLALVSVAGRLDRGGVPRFWRGAVWLATDVGAGRPLGFRWMELRPMGLFSSTDLVDG
jgi:hypothetical protein